MGDIEDTQDFDKDADDEFEVYPEIRAPRIKRRLELSSSGLVSKMTPYRSW